MAYRILRHLATKTGRLLAAGLLISTVTGGALAVQGANDAKAAIVWCSGDPTILVNGNPVSVTVSVPTERLRDVDYVTITFHVPSNANVQAILNTSVLFREKTVIVKDQPPVYGLVANVRIPVEVTTTARGTAFRQWATARLSELLVKGFTLDDERLKEGRSLGIDYFDELLERIRAIRASERMFYQKITDIYATSISPRRRLGDQEGRRAAGWRCDGHSEGRHRAGPRQRQLRQRSQPTEGQGALTDRERTPERRQRSTRLVLLVRPRVRSTSPGGT